MDKLLEFVKEHYDCVFIDTPPVNLVTDATVFAQKTTGYILIVKADATDIADVKASVSNLNNIGGNILGFILNDVTTGRAITIHTTKSMITSISIPTVTVTATVINKP